MKCLTTDLEQQGWLQHGFFTRLGGVSTGLYTSLNCGYKGEDKQTNVHANRARVAAAMGVPPENLVVAKQVHGIAVEDVKKTWAVNQGPEADGLVTTERNICLGVLTADCAPILFADKKKHIIGAAHAGWRGALAGIIDATVDAMKEKGSKAADIEAAVGPCIGPNSYEVREDFREKFMAVDKENAKFFKLSPRPNHLLFNLPGYVIKRLNALGIKTVYNTEQDTLTNEAIYFSNRRAFLRSEKGFGLQISAIVIK